MLAQNYNEFFSFILSLGSTPAVMVSIALLLSMLCCLEGYHLQKLIISAAAFGYAYTQSGSILPSYMNLSEGELLTASLMISIFAAAIAYKLYLFGIFLAVLNISSTLLPGIIDFGIYSRIGVWIVSIIAAILSVKLHRTAVIAVSSVIGGFLMVHFFLILIPLFPFALEFPSVDSRIYYFARFFLSVAGASIQLLTPEK